MGKKNGYHNKADKIKKRRKEIISNNECYSLYYDIIKDNESKEAVEEFLILFAKRGFYKPPVISRGRYAKRKTDLV